MPKGGRSKGHRESSAAKKKERAVRQALRRERKAGSYLSPGDADFKSFSNQLHTQGLRLRDVLGDGNCLFRALADQLLHNPRTNHATIRREVVRYMQQHREDFAPFVESGSSFEEYVQELCKDGEYAGNDAIVAFARCYGAHVCIHQLNAPRWEEHYCSVRPLIEGESLPQIQHHHQPVKQSTPLKGAPKFTPLQQQPPSPPLPSDLPTSTSRPTPSLETSSSLCSPPPPPPPPPCHPPSREGVTTAASDAVERVAQLSNCQDLEMVENALMENGLDEDRALAEVLQLMSLSEPGVERCSCVNPEDKPQARALREGEEQGRAMSKLPPPPLPPQRSRTEQPQRHLSNRERKEEAKAMRKERRHEEKRSHKTKKEPEFDPVGAMAI